MFIAQIVETQNLACILVWSEQLWFDYQLSHHIHANSGAHLAHCPVGTRDHFPVGKAAEQKLIIHLHPRSRICGALFTCSLCSLVAWCLSKGITVYLYLCKKTKVKVS
jgi:hypothetical protein